MGKTLSLVPAVQWGWGGLASEDMVSTWRGFDSRQLQFSF